jgi:hypothetical protein
VIAGFIVDFYCHKAALVLEVDGDIHDLQQEEDARRERVLIEMGLRINRFRNDEILSDLSVVVRRIKELVKFDNLIQQTRQQAKEYGLKQKDINSAVAKSRLHKLADKAIKDYRAGKAKEFWDICASFDRLRTGIIPGQKVAKEKLNRATPLSSDISPFSKSENGESRRDMTPAELTTTLLNPKRSVTERFAWSVAAPGDSLLVSPPFQSTNPVPHAYTDTTADRVPVNCL